jgi:hypothetical protein
MGSLLARQIVDVPSVRSLAEKRQQIWTREVLLTYSERGSWDSRVRAMNEEFDRMEEDYRLKFNRLVRTSRSINRISPAASFVDAATEIAGTGVGEETRLKSEVIRYKNQALPSLARDRTARDAPAFSYRARPLGEVLSDGGLFDSGLAGRLHHPFIRRGHGRLHQDRSPLTRCRHVPSRSGQRDPQPPPVLPVHGRLRHADGRHPGDGPHPEHRHHPQAGGILAPPSRDPGLPGPVRPFQPGVRRHLPVPTAHRHAGPGPGPVPTTPTSTLSTTTPCP